MKKLCSFMICIFLCAFALCACRTSDTPVKPDGGDSNMIFSSNTRVQIICNDLTSAHLPPVFEKVDSIIDYFPNVSDDSAEIAEHEIVIGETSRPISQKAYRLLDRMEHESESDVGYLIYSDGASVAIAYDEDIYGLSSAGAAAADCFVNEVIGDKTELSLPEGTVAKDDLKGVRYFNDLVYQMKKLLFILSVERFKARILGKRRAFKPRKATADAIKAAVHSKLNRL